MTKNETTPVIDPLRRRMRLQTIFIVMLSFAFLLQCIQLYRFQARIDFIDELGAQQGLELGSGLFDQEEEESSSLNTLMFSFVQNLGAYEKNKLRYEANLAVLQESIKTTDLSPYGLTLENPEGTYDEAALSYDFVDSISGVTLLSISLAYDGILSASTYNAELTLQNRESAAQSFADVLAVFSTDLNTLRQSVDGVNATRQALQDFLISEQMTTLLAEKKMTIASETETDENYSVLLLNSDEVSLVEWRVSKTSMGLSFESLDPAQTLLVDLANPESQSEVLALLQSVDARSALEKNVDAQKEELAMILSDPAFVETLNTVGLYFGPVLETELRLEYPLFNSDNQVLRILILDKTTGEIKVSSPDGTELQDLAYSIMMLEPSSKKKLSTYLV